MEIGLCSISNTAWPIDDVLDLAATVGYRGVEVWGKDHVGTPDAVGAPDLEMCRRIADRADQLGLDIPVYGSYLRPGTDGFRDSFEPELDAATALGADMIRVWAGEQEYENHSVDHWDGVVADLALLGDRAADRGIEVTVEKHEGSLTNRSEGARQLIEAVDSPPVGLNWQPLFFLDGSELLTEAERLAPLVNNVHLQATKKRTDNRRCLLSDAYFDVSGLLEVFHRAGFEGFVEVEFVDSDLDYETAVRKDYAFLETAVP